MLNQAVVMMAEDREQVTEEKLDISRKSTEEILDHADGHDLFTPVALKIFLAKGENGNGKSKTDPGLVDR
jgi:hypothetical protein